MMRLTPLIALAALAAAGAAHAQGGGLSPEAHAARDAVRTACATESQSLCAGKEQHGMMACLRDNAAKLSAPCADAMSKMPRRQPHGQ